MMQTGFTTPDDIFERLLQLDQLKIEKAKGTVLAVNFFSVLYLLFLPIPSPILSTFFHHVIGF